MPMTTQEIKVIEGIINRLTQVEKGGEPTPEIKAALIALNKHCYLDTWLVGPLKLLLAAQTEEGYQRKDTLRIAASMAN